jgi:hypothetical protein
VTWWCILQALGKRVSGLGTFFWVYDPEAPEGVPFFDLSRRERDTLVLEAFVIVKTIGETLAPTQSAVRSIPGVVYKSSALCSGGRV